MTSLWRAIQGNCLWFPRRKTQTKTLPGGRVLGRVFGHLPPWGRTGLPALPVLLLSLILPQVFVYQAYHLIKVLGVFKYVNLKITLKFRLCHQLNIISVFLYKNTEILVKNPRAQS